MYLLERLVRRALVSRRTFTERSNFLVFYCVPNCWLYLSTFFFVIFTVSHVMNDDIGFIYWGIGVAECRGVPRFVEHGSTDGSCSRFDIPNMGYMGPRSQSCNWTWHSSGGVRDPLWIPNAPGPYLWGMFVIFLLSWELLTCF